MPPEDRFVPRFAAEPPQEGAPYGRWADRLREEFLAACLQVDAGDEDVGEPGELTWFPDSTYNRRTYLPATAPTSNGMELYGYVSFVPGLEDREPEGFRAVADVTGE